MTVKILELAGKRWAIMSERDYDAWRPMPEVPEPKARPCAKLDARGSYPAVEYAVYLWRGRSSRRAG